MPIGDGGASWSFPPPPGDGRGGGQNPDETRLGYQLANFRDLTNQRFEQLTREMRDGFANVNSTIANQQYVTKVQYESDEKTRDLEIENLNRTQLELRGTISKLWWLLAGTTVAVVGQAALIVAASRGGP